MIKNVMTLLCCSFCLFCFWACETQKEEYPDIRIGKEEPIDELSLNKQTEKRILLSGGNGKYIANVENAQIATVRMSLDTLKIKGLLEGETFVTILSHDKRARLKINVVFPELGVSHSTVQFRPGFRSKYVSISGGGELARLEKNDPADIMDIKWDGATGILEINPRYEGEAEVTAVSQDGKEKKTIRIKVRPEGELEAPGWYGTNASSYYLIMNNQMVVRRKGIGTWLINSALPYGGSVFYQRSSIKIAPVLNPIQGDSIGLNVLQHIPQNPKLKEGMYRLYVEEIRETEVMLRGKGFKFLLPYKSTYP